MVYEHGRNDMRYGWSSENKWNKRVYRTWHNMIARCYSEKCHKQRPTYKTCNVCDDWLYLSNFIRDFKLIDGYDEEKFLKGELELDKDIKTNGANKVYSLENCIFISKTENVKQANKTRNNSYLQGENNPMYKNIKIAQYDKQGNLIKVWNGVYKIVHELGINHGHIIACCKFWEIKCNKEEWFKFRKDAPRKSCGGYIFKYYKDDE